MSKRIVPKRKPAFSVVGGSPQKLLAEARRTSRRNGKCTSVKVRLNQDVVYENKLNGVVVKVPKGTYWNIAVAMSGDMRFAYLLGGAVGCLGVGHTYPTCSSIDEWSDTTWAIVSRVLEGISLYEDYDGRYFNGLKNAEQKARYLGIEYLSHARSMDLRSARKRMDSMVVAAKGPRKETLK